MFFLLHHYNNQLAIATTNVISPIVPTCGDEEAALAGATGTAKLAFTNVAPHNAFTVCAAWTYVLANAALPAPFPSSLALNIAMVSRKQPLHVGLNIAGRLLFNGSWYMYPSVGELLFVAASAKQ